LIYKQTLALLQCRRVAENWLKLRPIAATVIFCGLQAITLRDHRDDWTTIDSDADDNHSENFCALLQFHVDAGDHTLKQHLETAAYNAIYNSKGIQNDLIRFVEN